MPEQHHHQQEQVPLVQGIISGETKDEEEEEEQDILEIIEELSDDGVDQDGNPSTTTTSNDPGEGSVPRPSAHEFSLSSISSIGFALADTLHASTSNLGSATASLHSKGVEKLRQSLSQIQASPRELNQASNHSARPSLRVNFGQKKPEQRVDFGPFQARADRLRYTQEDIFNIADNPAQMDDLRQALRSLGAITNTTLKQKLHWYVKNSKRARKEEEERQRLMEEEQLRRRQQEEQKEPEREVEPNTPPTEYKVIDGDKMLQSATGVINPEDPSPKSVRGIFVPARTK